MDNTTKRSPSWTNFVYGGVALFGLIYPHEFVKLVELVEKLHQPPPAATMIEINLPQSVPTPVMSNDQPKTKH